MKFFICTLALLGVAQAGLLPHLEHEHHHDDHLSHFVDADVHHSDGVHLGHSSAIVIDGGEHHVDAHPVYHHDGYAAHLDHADVHHAHADVHHHAHVHAPAKIVSHEPIHEVEPVHHVHKVVHDEPHHFLHYRNPVVDHHIIHNNAHVDEHAHLHADLHHADLHHGDLHHYAHHSAPLVHHHHAAPLVHHHHSHAALVTKAVYPAHLDVHSHANLLSFAKHHLHGKYGKVRITETHY